MISFKYRLILPTLIENVLFLSLKKVLNISNYSVFDCPKRLQFLIMSFFRFLTCAGLL